MSQCRAVPTDAPIHPAPPSASLRFFIVEDSVNMQVAVQELVCAVADATVVGVAASEAAALQWANAHEGEWGLAIVDLTLEQGDGFEIVRRLAQGPSRGAVVVFSAFVTDVIRRHCRALGADAVFHKSESAELARFVEELSGSPQMS